MPSKKELQEDERKDLQKKGDARMILFEKWFDFESSMLKTYALIGSQLPLDVLQEFKDEIRRIADEQNARDGHGVEMIADENSLVDVIQARFRQHHPNKIPVFISLARKLSEAARTWLEKNPF